MSRIGNLPVRIPSGVEVTLAGGRIVVGSSKGEMERSIPPGIVVSVEEGVLFVRRGSDSRRDRSMHGLTRTLIANMIHGASTGFEKALEISGVGYRAEIDGSILRLSVGFSKPAEYRVPPGVSIRVDKQVNVFVSGYDKELVGLVASQIRGIKKPEPYKGKGIRYANEVFRRKVGKSVGAK